jgi:hypothetical protein
MASGCEPVGPRREWLAYDLPPLEDADEDLALALFQPLEAPASAPSGTAGVSITAPSRVPSSAP